MNADDLGGAVPAASAVTQMSATDKISAMEKMLYGTEQAGALVGRMDSLEDDVYGTVTSDAILDRIDNLYDYLKGSPACFVFSAAQFLSKFYFNHRILRQSNAFNRNHTIGKSDIRQSFQSGRKRTCAF